MNLRNASLLSAFLLASVASAQVANGDWESSGPATLLDQCPGTSYDPTLHAPWNIYSTYSTNVFGPWSSRNFARILQRASNCGTSPAIASFPTPCPQNGFNPDSWDADCTNQRYMHLRFRSSFGTGAVGLVQEMAQALDTGCTYDLRMRVGAKATSGFNPTAPATYQIRVFLSNDPSCAVPGTLQSFQSLFSSSFQTQGSNACAMTWHTISVPGIQLNSDFSAITVQAGMISFPAGNNNFDVYLDDIQFAKTDMACSSCCNADCPADFNCDGIINTTDLTAFLGVFGYLTTDIPDPCLQLADFNGDGIVDQDDQELMMAVLGTVCGCCDPDCPGDLNCDGTVDGQDVDILTGLMGQQTADIPNPCLQLADLNGDGVVNATDLSSILDLVGTNCSSCCNADCPADFNCDGIINVTDLGAFNGVFGLLTANIPDVCMQLADFNGDGIVDQDDQELMMAVLGTVCGCCDPDCPGDLNCDGTVDGQDVDILTGLMGQQTADIPNPCLQLADLNGDGFVNAADLSSILDLVGTNCSSCCNAECWADFNCNGVIDQGDLSIFQSVLGQSTAAIQDPCLQLADFNEDGVVNNFDLSLFLGILGSSCSDLQGFFGSQGRGKSVVHASSGAGAMAEPNPSVGPYRITHDLPGIGGIDITVVDALGRVVLRNTVVDQQPLLLDLQDQRPGVYTAILQRQGTLSTLRLVRE